MVFRPEGLDAGRVPVSGSLAMWRISSPTTSFTSSPSLLTGAENFGSCQKDLSFQRRRRRSLLRDVSILSSCSMAEFRLPADFAFGRTPMTGPRL
jgi:hypothetical protein